MEQQLPTPLFELLIFNLYLASITYLLAIVFISLVIRANNFRWLPFLTISILTIALGLLGSLFLWPFWPAGIELMFGPLHLPTLISAGISLIALLKIAGYKIQLKRNN